MVSVYDFLSLLIPMFKRIKSYYKSHFWSLEKQARDAGVRMGNDDFIASHFWSTEPYLITIGNHCQITGGVKFYTHGGAGAVRKTYPKFDTFGKIIIGDYVYIGSNSMIMPGVTIGDNVLVAAGSVVTKSIPSNMVVAGNPARIICTIDDYIKKNMRYNTDTKGLDIKKKKEFLLKMAEDMFIKKELMIKE